MADQSDDVIEFLSPVIQSGDESRAGERGRGGNRGDRRGAQDQTGPRGSSLGTDGPRAEGVAEGPNETTGASRPTTLGTTLSELRLGEAHPEGQGDLAREANVTQGASSAVKAIGSEEPTDPQALFRRLTEMTFLSQPLKPGPRGTEPPRGTPSPTPTQEAREATPPAGQTTRVTTPQYGDRSGGPPLIARLGETGSRRALSWPCNLDRLPRPVLEDVGNTLGPTRRLPPGAWANTCRGRRVFLTQVLGQAEERALEYRIPQHPKETKRPCVMVHVAAIETGGLLSLKGLTGR